MTVSNKVLITGEAIVGDLVVGFFSTKAQRCETARRLAVGYVLKTLRSKYPLHYSPSLKYHIDVQEVEG